MSTASELAKMQGMKSLKEVSEMIGKRPETLNNWHKYNPALFRAVIVGCAVIKGEKNEQN